MGRRLDVPYEHDSGLSSRRLKGHYRQHVNGKAQQLIFAGNAGGDFGFIAGTLSTQNNCSATNLGGSNVIPVGDPLVALASGELLVNQASVCVDAGDNAAADAAYALAGLDWRMLTTDPDGAIVDGAGSALVDAGAHILPTQALIYDFYIDGTQLFWETNAAAAECTLRDDTGIVAVLTAADLPSGSMSHAMQAGDAATLTCDNPSPLAPASAAALAP